jgi:hypothetical protein
LAVGIGLAQHEPAISYERCSADAGLWYSNSDWLKRVSFNQLQQRGLEMMECSGTDFDNGVELTDPLMERSRLGLRRAELQRYFSIEIRMQTETVKRLQDFVRRHGENQQFLDEDAAGLR